MKWNYLIVLVLILLVLSGCTPKSSATPPPLPEEPKLPAPEEPKLPDLAWTDPVTFDPQDPVVGPIFSVKIPWGNVGTATASPGYTIIVEILSNGVVVFEQCFEEQPAMEPGEERTFHAVRKGDFSFPETGEYQVRLMLDSTNVVAESNEDNNIETLMITVSWPHYREDMAAVAKAKEDIEKYRKGNVTLTVLDSQGLPCSGLSVDYTQIEHSFLFGALEFPYNERTFAVMKEAGLNYAILHFCWNLVSRYSRLGSDVKSLHQAGFTLKAYGLIWLRPNKAPAYLEGLSFEQYKEAVYRHIYAVVHQYKNQIKIWNVMAEPTHTQATVQSLGKEQKIEVTKVGIEAIRDADPEAEITIDFSDPNGTYPYSFLQDAIDAGTDFDVVGLHIWYNCYRSVKWGLGSLPGLSLSSLGELIDRYAILGKKIEIDEFSVPSAHLEGKTGYWGQPWSQELQAEYLVAAYTIFFSKPQVQGITWHGASDRNSFIYFGGLVSESNQPKKAYYALKDLIESWTTNGTGVTDEKGQISFRGFGGTYEVVVSDPETGLSKKQEITVEEQKDNLISIVFD